VETPTHLHLIPFGGVFRPAPSCDAHGARGGVVVRVDDGAAQGLVIFFYDSQGRTSRNSEGVRVISYRAGKGQYCGASGRAYSARAGI
jgi:hypothetical protein